jgi:hypothetical protein
MTKTFDEICSGLLQEMVNQPPQNAAQQTNVPQTSATQQSSSTQNNMDYKKVWDNVSKLAPEHLTQLMNDLANHVKTLNVQQQNAPNKQT